jgi:UrcA family protein
MSSTGTMGNRKRFGILALCALAGSTVSPQHAAAAEPDGLTVSYGDLQLSRPGDARALYIRLQRAAESVCVAPSRYELERYAAFERCAQAALRDAVARINSPELTSTVAELNRAGGDYSSTAQTRR